MAIVVVNDGIGRWVNTLETWERRVGVELVYSPPTFIVGGPNNELDILYQLHSCHVNVGV